MFLKSVLLLLAVGSIDASLYDAPDTCVTPRLAHGRVRLRQRSRLARFTCLMRYELVGNKYATCRNGRWDVPMPVCVRPNCAVPQLQNGLSMLSHGGAWVIFFCFPNHELVGSPVIYCDGVRWNATAPKCVDSVVPPKLSCDFESPDLCGWKQDALHDFDWLRLNSKTPSSIFFTGPSYDHTLGMGKNGHYMYIESTSQVENDTARLISPVYNYSLGQNGCFSFSYHMFGKTCGGLRVYQKPDNVTLKAILDMPKEERRIYLLFEKWGNLGDTWFNAVSPLTHYPFDFQIVIEGIRGSSYTSDIAIDDVAILQGENCTAATLSATTPTTTVASDSCVNRCIDDYVTKSPADSRCSCSYACFVQEDCCPDFFAVCLYDVSDTTETETNANVTVKTVSEEAPQTLKLIAVTTESTTTTASTSTSTTSTTHKPTTERQTTLARSKPFTYGTRPKATLTTPRSTSRPKSTTLSTTTSTKTTRNLITTKRPQTTYIPTSTARITTYKRITSTTKSVPKSVEVKPLTTVTSTKKPPTTSSYKFSKPIDNDNYLESVEKEKEKEVIESRGSQENNKKVIHEEVKVLPPSGMSSSGKVVLVILVLASLSATAMMVHVGLRSTRLRLALVRLRGHRNRDPEVRYLSSDVDE